MNLGTTPATSMATALNTAIGTSAQLTLYSGIQPATAQTALSGNTALVTITMDSGGFGSVAGNVITAASLPKQANVTASGTNTVTFGRLYKSDGTTVIGDFTVGTSGQEITINTTSLVNGGPVQVTAFSVTVTL